MSAVVGICVAFLFMCLICDRVHVRCDVKEATELVEEHYQGKGSIYAEDLAEGGKFLNHFDTKADDLMNRNALANWDYETDLTEKNLQKTIEIGLEVSEFFLKSSENASQIKTLDLPNRIQRQISWIRRSADPTSDEMRREIKETIGKMTSIFGKGKVHRKSKNYTLNELTDILRTSMKKSELDWAWRSWRDTVGPPIRALYGNLVDLLNIGAREHGWIDYGNYLRSDYEMGDDFELSLDKVWEEIEPLYQELHAYVRYKLSKHYKYKKTGCIPANLFGDMFAQNWENIFHLVKPSKNSKTFDVTKELKRQKYTVKKMFHLAESFFVSIGLYKMPDSFWDKSVFTRPKDKEMVCHASAWDVSATDVRIKMCTKVRQSDLTTVHHEMGHIEYYLAYKDQPSTFRAGANPGFHEAIGDTISLSVETSSYLDDIGLMKTEKMDKDDTISFLLNQALRRIAPIPYNLLVDKWRWRVFEGNITENVYNKEWWKLRVRYQGVEPPVMRPEVSFDPASKYHIGANSPYISYFVSYVLQFQLHKAFCKESGFKGALHECSIYKSEAAGKKLRKMLESGRSEPWPKILKEATGDRDLKANAILQYFEPLTAWLKEQRASKKYPLGWKNKMSTQVMQKRKSESGQERSGILKTDSGDVQLSINIPTVALNEILGKSDVAKTNTDKPQENSKSEESTNEKIESEAKENAPQLDLQKLLTSGKPLSIKSVETSTMDSNGNKAKSIKEINIDNSGEKIKESGTERDVNEEAIQNLISALKGIQSNTSRAEDHEINDPNMPSAAVRPPSAKFPSVAASPNELKSNPLTAGTNELKSNPLTAGTNELKSNPLTAGISPEVQNPSTAGVPQEPKPNYVPSNQVALPLIPISVPNNILNEIQNAINNVNYTGPTSYSRNTSSFNDNVEKTEASEMTSTKNDSNITDDLGKYNTVDRYRKNDTDGSAMNVEMTSIKNDTKLLTSNSSVTENSADTKAENTADAKAKDTADTKAENTADTKAENTADTKAENTADTKAENALIMKTENEKKNETASTNSLITTENHLNPETHQNESTNSILKVTNDDSSDKPVPTSSLIKPNTTTTTTTTTTTDATSAVMETSKTNSNDTVPTDLVTSTDNKGFVSKQSVTPCRRSDNSPCFESKVVTEGNSLPTDDNKKGGKATISISPSVLIQKLIEHKVAEKSTPEPVVNIIPSNPNKDQMQKSTRTKDEEGSIDAKSPSAEVDINKLIKALTGGSVNPNVAPSSASVPFIKETKELGNPAKTSESTGDSSTTKASTNCSTANANKRGFSLNYGCPDDEKHKGGTLSISPTELIQKLLGGSKLSSNADKKTLPSTARVIKTANGFQLNFDLNTKDKIPADFSIKMTNPQGRQQHVDVLNTPKGMVVKPKSSLQLLTPLFVPVQSKDIVELGKDGK